MKKQKDTSKYVEAAKRRWADPTYRTRMSARWSAGQRKRYAKKSEREATSESMKKVHRKQRREDPKAYRRLQGARSAARKTKPWPLCTVCKKEVTHRQRKTCGPACASAAKSLSAVGNTYAQGSKQTAKRKKQIGTWSRKSWKNSEYRKKVIDTSTVGLRRADVRQRMSASKLMMWADPKHAVKHAKALMGNARYSRYEYLDREGGLHVFKSGEGWELSFAQWLDERELTWLYEPKTLLLSNGKRYIPDFWVAEWKTYIELKAPHRDTDKATLAKQDGHPMVILQGLEAIAAFKSTVEAKA